MNKYKLVISGRNTKYFLTNLIRKRIKLYYIKESPKKIVIIIDSNDFDKVIGIKSSCKIRVVNRYGIVKVKYLLSKYKIIIIIFAFCLFFLVFVSNIIFYVEIDHPKKEIRDLIRDDLANYGISKYHFIKTYNKKELIKKKILTKEKNKIEWLEIDRIGTKYIVNVEEKKLKKEQTDDSPQNIVAKKDSMILDIESENGEIIKKKYDYVKKGDIIISGTIMNKEKEVKKVKARGRVFGEVWYKVNIEIPTEYEERIITGNKKNVLSFVFLNKEHSLEIKKYKNYSFEEKVLLKNNLFPIKIVLRKKKEEIVKKKTYTINNIDKKALSLVRKKLNDKEIIHEKVLKKTLNKSTIVLDIFIKVKEDITKYQKITDLNLREDVNE